MVEENGSEGERRVRTCAFCKLLSSRTTNLCGCAQSQIFFILRVPHTRNVWHLLPLGEGKNHRMTENTFSVTKSLADGIAIAITSSHKLFPYAIPMTFSVIGLVWLSEWSITWGESVDRFFGYTWQEWAVRPIYLLAATYFFVSVYGHYFRNISQVQPHHVLDSLTFLKALAWTTLLDLSIDLMFFWFGRVETTPFDIAATALLILVFLFIWVRLIFIFSALVFEGSWGLGTSLMITARSFRRSTALTFASAVASIAPLAFISVFAMGLVVLDANYVDSVLTHFFMEIFSYPYPESNYGKVLFAGAVTIGVLTLNWLLAAGQSILSFTICAAFESAKGFPKNTHQ